MVAPGLSNEAYDITQNAERPGNVVMEFTQGAGCRFAFQEQTLLMEGLDLRSLDAAEIP
jgi:hypothetical protein